MSDAAKKLLEEFPFIMDIFNKVMNTPLETLERFYRDERNDLIWVYDQLCKRHKSLRNFIILQYYRDNWWFKIMECSGVHPYDAEISVYYNKFWDDAETYHPTHGEIEREMYRRMNLLLAVEKELGLPSPYAEKTEV